MDRDHEALLEEWAARPHHAGQAFVSDGVIDPSRFATAKRKVAFLLKEAHGGDSPWDLRTGIREEWGEKIGVSFWTAAYWSYAALHVTASSVPEIPSEPDKYPLAHEALLHTAIVNIKKSRGEHSSDVDDLHAYVKLDGDLIRRQIEQINPHLVICGGTWINVHNALWPDAKYSFDMLWQDGRRTFIDFWHPGYRVDHQLTYYALSCLLQRAAAWLPDVAA